MTIGVICLRISYSIIMNFQELIIASGHIGITLIIFAEPGLLIGVFFPGDSLPLPLDFGFTRYF